MTLDCEGDKRWDLVAGDSYTIPAGLSYEMSAFSDDLEILEITSPADFETTVA